MNSAWPGDGHLSFTMMHDTICPFSSTGAHPTAIKLFDTSTVTLILYPPPLNPTLTSCSPPQNPSLAFHSPPQNPFFIQRPPSPNSLARFFIYLCHLALPLALSSLIIFCSTMVSTRPKNKGTHPAAPVMTKAAKTKARIKTKPRKTKVTQAVTIRELRAHIAALEDPDGEAFSKEPLVSSVHLSCIHQMTNNDI